ncbi:nitric oxide synthase oxygenase [Rummeliibacillus stabekisii]|uniref:nitric oxide synthase oxygenase n=1 Tax=Rummeliibacillus stabekisii TaxID=241244 RepID=UPI0011680B1C|nr:nitric oxide synthase oxygenase [Rummeliibacillus stabekisii]MBB5171745.1 nitric-oxide synthase [Rummeliibacillus stabekisii]GEL06505.1 nitric oxide synthase oxygenase [Rummeliibacillus stabekisii]
MAIIDEAVAFLTLYYKENHLPDEQLDHRLKEVGQEIEENGSYKHTPEELSYGAQVAWRNSNKCIGRLFWKTLQVKDERGVLEEETIFQKLINHIEYAFNNGKIKPVITIFEPGRVRIWNHQLIRYAGYECEDQTIVGDADSVAFTNECLKLGWKGKGGQFDVLPLVIQVDNQPPKFFEIPSIYINEVEIRHPEYSWFSELHLKWYAVPIISSMPLEIGGVVYTAAPFNGWYMGTEIGARNLADENRYNQLPFIAKKMGLDMRSNTNLWQDRALIELNEAVLYSFREDGVSIVDHHTAAQQFKRFEMNEEAENRDVTGNWTWLIPPLSPALTHIFHKPYKNKKNTPSYMYRPSPFKGLGDRKSREE